MTQPDWHCAEDYTFTEKLDNASWVWEFLRRNPEYVEDWLVAVQQQQSAVGTYFQAAADDVDPVVDEDFHVVAAIVRLGDADVGSPLWLLAVSRARGQEGGRAGDPPPPTSRHWPVRFSVINALQTAAS